MGLELTVTSLSGDSIEGSLRGYFCFRVPSSASFLKLNYIRELYLWSKLACAATLSRLNNPKVSLETRVPSRPASQLFPDPQQSPGWVSVINTVTCPGKEHYCRAARTGELRLRVEALG